MSCVRCVPFIASLYISKSSRFYTSTTKFPEEPKKLGQFVCKPFFDHLETNLSATTRRLRRGGSENASAVLVCFFKWFATMKKDITNWKNAQKSLGFKVLWDKVWSNLSQRQKARRQRMPSSQGMEYSPLEPRQLLASLVVSSLADVNTPGELNLREAIAMADQQAGDDTITFDPILFDGSPQEMIQW